MIKDPAIIRDELINHIPISPSDFYENCHLKYFISKDNDISFSTGGKFISRCNNHILLKNNGSPWRIPIHIYNKGGDIIYSTRFFILEDEFNQKKDISEDISEDILEDKYSQELKDTIEYQQSIIEKLIERVKEVEIQKHDLNDTISQYEELLQQNRYNLKNISFELREKTNKLNYYEELIPKLYNSR